MRAPAARKPIGRQQRSLAALRLPAASPHFVCPPLSLSTCAPLLLQGHMFGYATDETPELMPLTHMLATQLGYKLTEVRVGVP